MAVDPAKTYDGSPCKTCGGSQRWRCDRSCVECNRTRSRHIQRRRSEDHITYYSKLLSNRRRAALKRQEERHRNG